MTDAAAVLDALRDRGWTLAVAESLTGGAVTDAFVRVPGASAVLVGAVVAYATPLKASVLGVERALLDAEGPVHPEVAVQMADGVRRALAVDGRPGDVGLATTGVAGPEPQGGQPPGTVYVAVVTPLARRVVRLDLGGDRSAVRNGAVEAVVELLRSALVQE